MNPEYPVVSTFQKTPVENKWVPVNWAIAFPIETITLSDWVIISGGLIVVTADITGKVARALIGGGTQGTEAYVENRVTLNTGEIRVARFRFEVKA
jgi:hypothetical protein